MKNLAIIIVLVISLAGCASENFTSSPADQKQEENISPTSLSNAEVMTEDQEKGNVAILSDVEAHFQSRSIISSKIIIAGTTSNPVMELSAYMSSGSGIISHLTFKKLGNSVLNRIRLRSSDQIAETFEGVDDEYVFEGINFFIPENERFKLLVEVDLPEGYSGEELQLELIDAEVLSDNGQLAKIKFEDAVSKEFTIFASKILTVKTKSSSRLQLGWNKAITATCYPVIGQEYPIINSVRINWQISGNFKVTAAQITFNSGYFERLPIEDGKSFVEFTGIDRTLASQEKFAVELFVEGSIESGDSLFTILPAKNGIAWSDGTIDTPVVDWTDGEDITSGLVLD